ncbi:MAG: CehA/McbA family metallohydrolase [Verrucomicrobiales bacterium]
MGSKYAYHLVVIFLVFGHSISRTAEIPGKVLLQQPTYISKGGPEWDIFRDRKSSGTNLVIEFQVNTGGSAYHLLIDQEDVKQDWEVEFNGKKVGKLFLMEERLIHSLAIPAGVLIPGTNRLAISTGQQDDILLHRISISESNSLESLKGSVQIEVKEKGNPVPARITVVNQNRDSFGGGLAPVWAEASPYIAVRPGVVYSVQSITKLELLEGAYTIYASRGPEYTVATNSISVASGSTNSITMEIARVAEVSGFVSVDTHVHTLSFSKHGDATLDERLLTIAGEGINIPIATEHNLHTSYEPRARELGLTKFFHPIAGNEVTTTQGHFNLFPVTVESSPTNPKLTNWTELISEMRRVPDSQMVILNHPWDVHSGFRPFAATNFIGLTGRNLRGDDFTFDGMELINSGAMRSDWMEPFRGWFGLLNRGLRIVGVGASDSHDVSRFIVGQGRTYISTKGMGKEFNPALIWKNLREGRAIVSLGLVPQIQVNERFSAGDIVQTRNGKVNVEVSLSPSPWMQVTNIMLYVNGQQLKNDLTENPIHHENEGKRYVRVFELEAKNHDYYIAAIASGPGVTAPYWPLARPYQPSSKAFVPMLLGATNPVYVDADNDGKWTSPRHYARKLLAENGVDGTLKQLLDYDWAVASQSAELLFDAGELDSEKLKSERFSELTDESRRAFEDFLRGLKE